MFLIDVWRAGARPATHADPPPPPIVEFFRVRLKRLLARRFAAGARLSPEAARQLDQAIFSTYRDLQAFRRETEARAIVCRYRGCVVGSDAEFGSDSRPDRTLEHDERSAK